MRAIFFSLVASLLVFSAFDVQATEGPNETLGNYVKRNYTRQEIVAFNFTQIRITKKCLNCKKLLSSLAPPSGEKLIENIHEIEEPILVLGGGYSKARFSSGRHVIIDRDKENTDKEAVMIEGFDFNDLHHWFWFMSKAPREFKTVMFDVCTVHHSNWTPMHLVLMKECMSDDGTFYLPVDFCKHPSYKTLIKEGLLELNSKTNEISPSSQLLSPIIKTATAGQFLQSPDDKQLDQEVIQEVTPLRVKGLEIALSKLFGDVQFYDKNAPYPDLGSDETNEIISKVMCFVCKDPIRKS